MSDETGDGVGVTSDSVIAESAEATAPTIVGSSLNAPHSQQRRRRLADHRTNRRARAAKR